MNQTNWYLIVIIAVITIGAGIAVALLPVVADYPDVEWFKNVGLTGFGVLAGLVTGKKTDG